MRLEHALLATALLAAGPAVAGPALTLNGVPIDGATSQRIENATVVIDERGNVDIIAKGYAVAGEPDAPKPTSGQLVADARSGGAAPEARLQARWFLVGEQSEPDGTGYDVAVFINGRWVKELRSAEEQRPFEVTRFLAPGPNKVVLVATKRARSGVRRAGPRDVTSRVVLGEAAVAGDLVTVERPAVEMRRSAAEVETFTQEYELVAR